MDFSQGFLLWPEPSTQPFFIGKKKKKKQPSLLHTLSDFWGHNWHTAWRRKCTIVSCFSFWIPSSWDRGWPLGPWPSWMWLTCVISRLVRENQGNCYQNNYIQGRQNNGLRAPRDLETILALPRMPSGTVAKSHHLFVSSFPPGKLKLFLLLPVSEYIIKNKLR